MQVGVPRVPAALVHRCPPTDPEREFPLPGSYPDLLPERLVFKTAGDIDDEVSGRQPALAGSVDIGITKPAQPDGSPDGHVPGAEIRNYMPLVTVRLLWNALHG